MIVSLLKIKKGYKEGDTAVKGGSGEVVRIRSGPSGIGLAS
ncbi:MAG: hypothetical protein ACXQT2_01250 [Methanotrichaceae archaeon]